LHHHFSGLLKKHSIVPCQLPAPLSVGLIYLIFSALFRDQLGRLKHFSSSTADTACSTSSTMAATGLPPLKAAEFIEDVEQYMRGKVLEDEIVQLQERLRDFKQREQQLLLRRARLQQREPEIRTALEAVRGLLDKKGSGDQVQVDFELTEAIYAKAALQDVDSVNLWLGANVMVEYPLEEAEQLLQQQLDVCTGSLEAISKDMEATKDSLTITEVSIARVFNWDVEQRRKAKSAGAAAGSKVAVAH
jgi:prefoldin subunit 5